MVSRKQKLSIGLGLLLFTAFVALCTLYPVTNFLIHITKTPPLYNGPVQTLRLGAEIGPLASSVWVAEEKGFFTEYGLNLQLTEFPSGRAALTSMLKNGELDMVTVAQTPIVFNSFTHSEFAVIAAMVSSGNDVKILTRKDRNMIAAADLLGKKIGVTKSSTGHYFLGLYLAQYGYDLTEVTLVDIEANALPDAINNGTVDAIVTWEPNINKAKVALGDRASVLESRGTFREDYYFVVLKDFEKSNPEALRRFLMAIKKAEEYIAQNPSDSQRIVSERLSMDPVFISSIWDEYSFGLFLDQAVLLTFEQQARWMIANGITNAPAPANYLDFLSFQYLEAVKPDSITILR